ncbi:MAG: DUF2294 family protein [Caldilineaceae bacterium]|nr:DUF2294 family protein [Caldilineaceae bacterium]
MTVEAQTNRRERRASPKLAMPPTSRYRRWQDRITEGQLEAVAMRCREELDVSLRRAGTNAVATLRENQLTVRVEHSLSAAEQNLMRKAAGRAFFQRYMEELAEQVYPTFAYHVQHILPCSVTYTQVQVDCESDSIIFRFGLRPSLYWTSDMADDQRPAIHHG